LKFVHLLSQFYCAKRDVSNEEGANARSNKTLSKLSYKFFNSLNKSESTDVSDLQVKLVETDDKLNEAYKKTFQKVADDINKFSYSSDESKISVKSNLEEMNILKENTSVVYKQGNKELPEDYNGLGYMNLDSDLFKELKNLYESLERVLLLLAFAPSSFETSLFALIALSEIIFEICSSFISILFSSWLYSTIFLLITKYCL
jgi:hypothetical protein